MENAIVLSGDNFLAPAATLNMMLATYQMKKDFIDTILKDGVDFGTIPGTSDKRTLKKAGAEKMASFFGLAPTFEDIATVEDWTGQEHGGEAFFYYRQKCKLMLRDRLIASADGSCNSWEKKYRYRWIGESEIPQGMDKLKLKTRGGRISEFTFAIDKAETTGKYGKPAAYWKQFKDAIASGKAAKIMRKTKTGQSEAWEIDSTLYSVPNDDVAEQVNTILKMAQKRALVAAVLIATNASDYFTQDIEDFVGDDFVEGQFTDQPKTTTPPPAVSHRPAVAPVEPPMPDEPIIEGEATALPKLRYNPEQLILKILEVSRTQTGPANGKKGVVVSMLDSILSGTTNPTESRHMLLKYLTGKSSTKDIPDPMILALYKWLSPKQDSGGEWQPDAMSVREALAAFVAAQPKQDALFGETKNV